MSSVERRSRVRMPAAAAAVRRAWAAAQPRQLRSTLGIRWIDVGATAAVIAAVELSVAVGGGPGAARLDAAAYLLGAILALPVLVRRKWPLGVLIACSVLLLAYYSLDRRNISPAPLLSLPLYDAAVAGFLLAAIVIPAVYMTIGLFVVEYATRVGLAALAAEFLPSIVVLALAISLGEVVRSRRALAAETAGRLRLATEEREAEAGRRVAEERLRIARELHDTVAHSMATITVQAGSALHVLGPGDQAGGPDGNLRSALIAIRETSKGALTEMRATLGQLRHETPDESAELRAAGLDRLPALCEAVTAAGAPVSLTTEGQPRPVPPAVGHAAYRILQESLTNVLRHAGVQARAAVCLSYEPGALAIRVSDDGAGPLAAGEAAGLDAAAPGDQPSGHGLTGMAERAAAVGGSFSAAAGPDGGFEVVARLPLTPPDQAAAQDAGPGRDAADGPGQGAAPGTGQAAAHGTAPVAAADLAR
jgi:signal transduction histidine kinase